MQLLWTDSGREREKVEITHSERRRGLKKCTTSGEWGG